MSSGQQEHGAATIPARPASQLDPGLEPTLPPPGELSARADGGAGSPLTGPGLRTTVLPCPGPEGKEPAATADRPRFECVRLLGRGGMGEVALAHDNDIGRKVAIKHLLARQGLERFAEEVRTVGQLEHPNIPPVHDVGVDERGHFFVMKYVDGETLAEVIARLAADDPAYRRQYSFERRTEIFVGVLRALQFAHEHGVVHRDLKPANVMIGRHGEVMLMDWGVAKSVRRAAQPWPPQRAAASPAVTDPGTGPSRPGATSDGELIGTPLYMSPEQARGDNSLVDHRSDLYSAAVLFHELLCLRHYLADLPSLPALLRWLTSQEELGLIALGARRHPGAAFPPSELLHFLRRGLRKDPAQRFQSAAEMIEALGLVSEGRFQVRCSFTLAKRFTRELGRLVDHRPFIGLMVLLSLLGLAGYGLVRAVLALVG